MATDMTSNEMTCAQVRQHMCEFIDAEMPEEMAAKMEQHISECSTCRAEQKIEQLMRMMVRRSCCENAPEELRVRIITQITTIRTHLE